MRHSAIWYGIIKTSRRARSTGWPLYTSQRSRVGANRVAPCRACSNFFPHRTPRLPPTPTTHFLAHKTILVPMPTHARRLPLRRTRRPLRHHRSFRLSLLNLARPRLILPTGKIPLPRPALRRRALLRCHPSLLQPLKPTHIALPCTSFNYTHNCASILTPIPLSTAIFCAFSSTSAPLLYFFYAST